MRNLAAVLLSLSVVLPPALAAGTVEAVRAAGAAGLGAAGAFQPKAFKAQRMVPLWGQASLNGTGFVFGQHTTYVTVNLSGQLNASGDGGRVQTGGSMVSQTVSLFLSPGQTGIYQSVSINQNVGVYCNGRYAGSAFLNGTIHVSGFRSGNYISLSGSGPVSGSAFVDCGDNAAR